MDSASVDPSATRKRLITATLALLLLARLAFPTAMASVTHNWTIGAASQGAAGSCLPWTVFIVHHKVPLTLTPGTLIEFKPPPAMRNLIGPFPVIKMIAAGPGDLVEEHDGAIWINGRYWGKTWLNDYLRASGIKPATPERMVIPVNHYLVLGTSPDSYDSRYWGLVSATSIDGTARPL
jgi:conjugal transfer pilin signal peptidase TrbI